MILKTLENIRGHEGVDVKELSACCAKMRSAIQAVEKGEENHEGLLVTTWREAKQLLEKYAKYV